jgi:organic radical activating enzyme
MSEPSAPLHEVFFSVQGEGLWVGVPQVFVRVAGCDLACWYCDTAAARQVGPQWTLELPGARPCVEPNPVAVGRLLALLEDWLASPGAPALHSVALTGGEPLLYPDFTAALGQGLAEAHVPLYLETGGHHPQELAQVIRWTDYLAVDYKLPSTLPEPVPAARFAESVRIAAQKQFFVKMVVTDRVSDAEVAEACGIVAAATSAAALVLQPVTGVSRAGGPPAGEQLFRWLVIAQRCGLRARIIPQCHKLLGVR